MRIAGLWIVVIVVGICLIAGCATSPPNDSVGPTQTTAPGAPSTTPTPGVVQAVNFNVLLPFLPNPPAGWTADEPTGGSITTQEGSWSTASREYTNNANDELQASITIVDSAYYAVGGWDAWRTFTTIETSDGYFRSGQVAGFPAWETYSKPSSYGKWIGINERFMIYVSIDGGTKTDLDLFVNAINYGGIAALG